MAPRIVEPFEVVDVQKQERSDVLRPHVPKVFLNEGLRGNLVVKARQRVVFRPLPQLLEHLAFFVDIQNDAHGFQGLPIRAVLGRAADSAPGHLPVGILNPYVGLNKAGACPDLCRQGPERVSIVRMDHFVGP